MSGGGSGTAAADPVARHIPASATITATAAPAGRRLRLPPGLAGPADVRVLLLFQNDRKVPPAFSCPS